MKRDFANWLSWSVSAVGSLGITIHAAITGSPVWSAFTGTFAVMCAFLAGACFESMVSRLHRGSR